MELEVELEIEGELKLKEKEKVKVKEKVKLKKKIGDPSVVSPCPHALFSVRINPLTPGVSCHCSSTRKNSLHLNM
jgi:hypothetical protein